MSTISNSYIPKEQSASSCLHALNIKTKPTSKAAKLIATKDNFRAGPEEYLTTSLSIIVAPIAIIGTANTLITVRTLVANFKRALTKYCATRGCNICKDVSKNLKMEVANLDLQYM